MDPYKPPPNLSLMTLRRSEEVTNRKVWDKRPSSFELSTHTAHSNCASTTVRRSFTNTECFSAKALDTLAQSDKYNNKEKWERD